MPKVPNIIEAKAGVNVKGIQWKKDHELTELRKFKLDTNEKRGRRKSESEKNSRPIPADDERLHNKEVCASTAPLLPKQIIEAAEEFIERLPNNGGVEKLKFVIYPKCIRTVIITRTQDGNYQASIIHDINTPTHVKKSPPLKVNLTKEDIVDFASRYHEKIKPRTSPPM